MRGKNEKVHYSFSFGFLLCFAFVSPAYGDQWSPAKEWGPSTATKPFSPHWGRAILYEYTDGAYNLYISPQTRFNFTHATIAHIQYLFSCGNEYYTFDTSVKDESCSGEGCNTTVTALDTTMYYTTLPEPHFDRDNDPEESGGNGWYDETEVVCLNPGEMLADTDYRFESHFKVYFTTPNIDFEFASQESYPFGDEYNTADGETHTSLDYPWY